MFLAVDGGTFYETDIKASPYINGPNILQIYPGEKVYVEVNQDHGDIKSFQCMKENKNPNKTIEVSFTQNVNNKQHEGMMLKISNPFSMDLKYRASIFTLKKLVFYRTLKVPHFLTKRF